MKTRRLACPAPVLVIACGFALVAASLAGCDDSQPQGPSKGGPAAQAKVVNAKCPMMGNTIDPAAVPANLTREFKGQKVGFCCAGCPAAWDKLSDEQKATKLAAAMPPAPK
ncbi:MAG: hypothetical protein WBF17_14615 [Phycisphaerae bacterium]